MKTLYEYCPRYSDCNCNICPLDEFSHEKESLAGEEKCHVEKRTRLRIVSEHPEITLISGGLTKKEVMRKNASDRAKGVKME